MVGEEGLGEGISSRLLDEIIQATPSHVTVPSNFDVAHHLVDSGALEKSGRHRVRAVQMTHQAIADGHVDLRVGRFDEVSFARQVGPVEGAILAAKDTVAIPVTQLKVMFRGMA